MVGEHAMVGQEQREPLHDRHRTRPGLRLGRHEAQRAVVPGALDETRSWRVDAVSALQAGALSAICRRA